MSETYSWPVIDADIQILRGLFERKSELAHLPEMQIRKQLWQKHASLQSTHPMILAETSGVLNEVVPISSLRCQADWARDLERGLLELIFRVESVRDDFVVEPRIQIGWEVTTGNFGVSIPKTTGHNETKLASYHWDPPIKDLDRDFDRLHFRELSVNREKTAAWQTFLENHFGDILPVQIRANYWWTTGLTWSAIELFGMEPMMMAMYDNPAGLHRLMGFLRDDFMHYLDWFEAEGLLTLNNEDDYVGSGSIGYTTELPGPAWKGEKVTAAQLWGLSESQETVGVSKAMFDEFVFPYQVPIISRFGLSYYGCCEPLHNRIKTIRQLPNLRRVSVSPWCKQDVMVNELGSSIIYCRKPNPTQISTEVFDENAMRQDIRSTLQAFDGCPLEFAMKDVHTLNEQPARMGRWVTLAREEIDRFGS